MNVFINRPNIINSFTKALNHLNELFGLKLIKILHGFLIHNFITNNKINHDFIKQITDKYFIDFLLAKLVRFKKILQTPTGLH